MCLCSAQTKGCETLGKSKDARGIVLAEQRLLILAFAFNSIFCILQIQNVAVGTLCCAGSTQGPSLHTASDE